jgi:lipoprotein-releasing system ATP-binding protein
MNNRGDIEKDLCVDSVVRPEAVVRADGIRKNFKTADGILEVLRGVDLSIDRGDVVSIVGESGAGKSTLLHILGGLDTCSAGDLTVCGARYSEMDDDSLASFRNDNIGFVFQFHHLMSDFSAVENVMIPLMIRGDDPVESNKRALKALDMVGVAERASHRPGKMSGGEQQRVAVARALVGDPKLVLADEPSGNLDMKTADRLHDTLIALNKDHRITFVVATHNREFAARTDRVYNLLDGRLTEVGKGDL